MVSTLETRAKASAFCAPSQSPQLESWRLPVKTPRSPGARLELRDVGIDLGIGGFGFGDLRFRDLVV